MKNLIKTIQADHLKKKPSQIKTYIRTKHIKYTTYQIHNISNTKHIKTKSELILLFISLVLTLDEIVLLEKNFSWKTKKYFESVKIENQKIYYLCS